MDSSILNYQKVPFNLNSNKNSNKKQNDKHRGFPCASSASPPTLLKGSY